MILLPILCQSLVMNGVLCQKVHTVAWDLPFHLKKKITISTIWLIIFSSNCEAIAY